MSFHSETFSGFFCLIVAYLCTPYLTFGEVQAFPSPQKSTNSTQILEQLDLNNSTTTLNSSLIAENDLEELEISSSASSLLNETNEEESPSSALLSSVIGHRVKSSLLSIVEGNDAGSGSGDDDIVSSTTINELGTGNSTLDEMLADESASSDGSGSGFGELISAVYDLFNFTVINRTGTEAAWTSDPTGTEIQALLFS